MLMDPGIFLKKVKFVLMKFFSGNLAVDKILVSMEITI